MLLVGELECARCVFTFITSTHAYAGFLFSPSTEELGLQLGAIAEVHHWQGWIDYHAIAIYIQNDCAADYNVLISMRVACINFLVILMLFGLDFASLFCNSF